MKAEVLSLLNAKNQSKPLGGFWTFNQIFQVLQNKQGGRTALNRVINKLVKQKLVQRHVINGASSLIATSKSPVREGQLVLDVGISTHDVVNGILLGGGISPDRPASRKGFENAQGFSHTFLPMLG